MSEAQVIDVGRDALMLMLYLSGPMLLVALIIGFGISLFQAMTHINEMTLTFIPKVVAVILVLLFLLPTMVQMFRDFFERLMQLIPGIIP